ncbi:MAG: glycoside hydrolase family 88 protein [Ferruginibacter sp.]|nr:glycoside hydrolase family 88 protein [Ferruginibacter sp.]
MERRDFTTLLLSVTTGGILSPLLGKSNNTEHFLRKDFFESKDLPDNLPANIRQLIRNTLQQEFSKVNTDWFGSIQVEGLLRFANRGFKEGYDFADKWFKYHVNNDGKLTDEEYFKQYEGAKARILRDGPLTFVIYSANLGVAFPVHELYKINKSPVAKRVCFDVADAVLHYAGRDKFGMLAHDDNNYMEFAIPDTAYWATRSNAIAASMCTSKELAAVYWKQSIFQLDQGIKYFLDTEEQLVRTGLFKGVAGKTYWCRSQGWLAWAIAGLLRYLPKDHPRFNSIASSLTIIANGFKKYQSENGAIRVLANDATTPEEVTGTAMLLSAVKEAVRKGWIPNEYKETLAKAWSFILKSVDEKGNVHNAYTGWAVPAENKEVNKMDERFMGFVPGVIIVAADEMTR